MSTTTQTVDKKPQELIAALGDQIDLLGSSVVRLKQNQVVEGQEIIEELEARYTALRGEFQRAKQGVEDAETARQAHDVSWLGGAEVSKMAQSTLAQARNQIETTIANAKERLAEIDAPANVLRDAQKQWSDAVAKTWSQGRKAMWPGDTATDDRDETHRSKPSDAAASSDSKN